MKSIYKFLVIVLLIGSNGCMSSTAVHRAKGYSSELLSPTKGDIVFEAFDYRWYTIPRASTNRYKLPDSKRQVVVFTQPADLPTHVVYTNSSDPNAPRYFCRAYRPNIAFYLLVPLAFPVDIVTSPLQLYVYLGFKYGDWHM